MWQLTHGFYESYSEHKQSNYLKEMLDNDWEPFAVDGGTVWLRKWTENTEEVRDVIPEDINAGQENSIEPE